MTNMGEAEQPGHSCASKLCIDQCRHRNSSSKQKSEPELILIRCCVCATWFHVDCLGLPEDEAAGVWPCISCRLMPHHIISLQNDMATLMTTTNKILEKLNGLATSLDEKTVLCEKLQGEKTQLLQRVTDLNEQLTRQTWVNFRNKPTLVLGDSIVRDIDEEKLVKTKVVSKSGATTKDIAETLQQDDNSYSSVVICVGTNDCKKQPMDLDIIKANYKDIIEAAKSKVASTAEIKVCSITPRTDDPKSQENVDKLNDALQQMAATTGVSYINNSNFKLSDGEINDGYLLSDGVHLNRQGSNRLVKNMKLITKRGHETDVTKSRHTRNNKSSDANRQGHPITNHTSNRAPNKTTNYAPKRSHSTRRHSLQHRRNDDCTYCGEPNHSSNQCRWGKPIVCHQCNTPGHKMKFCTHHNAD